MKKLISLFVIALHLSGAIAALAAPKAPALPNPAPVPKPPAVPAPPASPASAAESVKIVNGSATVEKSQTVKDATAVNGNVTVLGHVTGSATAVNGNVYIRFGGKVDGNATAVNGKVVKDPGGFLGGTVSSVNGGNASIVGGSRDGVHRIGNNVTVPKGKTVNEATAVQGDVTVYGHVTGDANSVMGNVYIKHGGRVDGDATAVLGKVVQSDGGTVGGEVTSLDFGIPRHGWWTLPGGAWWTSSKTFGGWWMYALYIGGIMAISALITAVVIALFPQRMTAIAECSLGRPGWSILYGIFLSLLVVPIAFLLLITCIGIPLIVVEGVFLVLLLIAGIVGFHLALGQKIGIGVGHPIASAILAGIVGSIIMTFLHLVPFIGGLIVWILYLVGTGAALMTGFGARPDWFASRFDRSSRPCAEPAAASTGYNPPPAPPAGPVEG